MRSLAELHPLIHEKFRKIVTWDLSSVRAYLEQNKEYTSEQTAAMELEYKKFIALSFAVEKGRNIPISDKVDPFWHTHIMFTHDYTMMCHALGGDYIHHVPAITQQQRDALCDDYNQNTLPLYREIFGEPDANWWPADASICIVCCDRHAQMTEDRVGLQLSI